MYRIDKFSAGDKVVFAGAYSVDEQRLQEKMGNGPFTIAKVFDRPLVDDPQGIEQSNWESMGHTQHVVLEEFPTDSFRAKNGRFAKGDKLFSGAFFIRVSDVNKMIQEESESMSINDYIDDPELMSAGQLVEKIHHVDVYAVFADGSRRVSYSGPVNGALDRYGSRKDYPLLPSFDDFVVALTQQEEVSLPPMLTRSTHYDPRAFPGAFIFPFPEGYVAIARYEIAEPSKAA